MAKFEHIQQEQIGKALGIEKRTVRKDLAGALAWIQGYLSRREETHG